MNVKSARPGQAHSLRIVSRELRRVNRALALMAVAGAPRARPQINPETVRAINAARRLREQCFEPAVAEAGWALLLEAYAARLDGRAVTMTGLGEPAGIARSTAHRWAGQLIDRGLLVRLQDGGDDRTIPVALADDAAERVRLYLEAALELSPWLL